MQDLVASAFATQQIALVGRIDAPIAAVACGERMAAVAGQQQALQ
jgi:hypothetical protein